MPTEKGEAGRVMREIGSDKMEARSAKGRRKFATLLEKTVTTHPLWNEAELRKDTYPSGAWEREVLCIRMTLSIGSIFLDALLEIFRFD